MADVVDKATRSRMMAGIRGKHTKPELEARRALHALGFRFRTNVAKLPGTPDIVLSRWNAVILVHGCFWHRHPGCRFATIPSTRPEFWQAKFSANVSRDIRNLAQLEEMGWRVAVIWECALRGNRIGQVADQVAIWLKSREPSLTLSSDGVDSVDVVTAPVGQ